MYLLYKHIEMYVLYKNASSMTRLLKQAKNL